MKLSLKFSQVFYNCFALPIGFVAMFFGSMVSAKIRRGLMGRRGVFSRVRSKTRMWPKQSPRIWIHVSSVGELLQSRPVAQVLRNKDPSVKIFVTCFSPSGVEWAQSEKSKTVPAWFDGVDYFPSDSWFSVRRMLNILRPQVLVLAKFDVWPNLIWSARARGVKVHLLAATLRAESLRFQSKIGRAFFETVYTAIDRIFAVSPEDLERFRQTAPGHNGLVLSGDTRVDSVLDRKKMDERRDLSQVESRIAGSGRWIVVAGSTWQADEDRIFSKWHELELAVRARLLVVVVPHEKPNRLTELLREHRIEYLLYSELEGNPGLAIPGVIVVDRLGLLASLYRVARLAYVGSGAGGVHNTMEPAAWGCPIVFGPRFQNSPEAIRLQALGAAHVVSSADEWNDFLTQVLKNSVLGADMGSLGLKYLEGARGSSHSCAEMIAENLNVESVVR